MSNLKIYLFCSLFCVFALCLIEPLLADSNDFCGDLPKQCTIYKEKSESLVATQIDCDLNDGRIVFNSKGENNTADLIYLKRCNEKHEMLNTILFVNKPWFKYIIDQSFDFNNLFAFIKIHCKILKMCDIYSLEFSFLDGFELIYNSISFLSKNNLDLDPISNIEFYKSKFHFYLSNKRLIKSCQNDLVYSKNISSIVNMKHWRLIYLKDNTFDIEVCPLIFANANIIEFHINGMIKSFHKINVLKFSNMSFPNLNSKIKMIYLSEMENIDLDSSFLNKHVFQNIRELGISGQIKSIQVDIFKPFQKLKVVYFDTHDVRQFFHKNGIEWINNFNGDINVNPSQLTFMSNEEVKRNLFEFGIRLINRFKVDENMYYIQSSYPDEDFCLYRHFPFHKMIFFYDQTNSLFKKKGFELTKMTCTYMWLIQLYPIVSKWLKHVRLFIPLDFHRLTNECDFETRLRLCNKTSILLPINNNNGNLIFETDENFTESRVQIDLVRLIFIFISPVISILGLVTNIMVIIIIRIYKNKTKGTKDLRLYDFIVLNAISNICIFSIELIGLMNQCTDYFWCSPISYSQGAQYYKKIVGELINTFFIFMSNFTHVAFLLSRLSLIGNKHGKIVTSISSKTSDCEICIWMLGFAITSLILSVVKYFIYVINVDFIDFISIISYVEVGNKYPRKFSYAERRVNNNDLSKTTAVTVINIVSDFVNYLMFFIVNMSIEIYSNILFKVTLKEKANQITDPKAKEKIEMQNAKSIKRNNRMVKWNIIADLLLKLPVILSVILETISAYLLLSSFDQAGKDSLIVHIMNLFIKTRFKNSFNHFCIQLNGCQMLEDIFNVLFLFYLSLPLLFYYKYDLNFKQWFKNLFKISTISDQQQNQQSNEPKQQNQTNKTI